jgi:hypothetical protein
MRLVWLPVVGLIVAGCGAGHGQAVPPAAPTGVLSGRLVGTGGPYGAADTPYAGEVRAVRADGRSWTARTDPQGRFSLTLPAGDYELSGQSPSYDVGASWPCQAVNRVTVGPPHPALQNVWCQRR